MLIICSVGLWDNIRDISKYANHLQTYIPSELPFPGTNFEIWSIFWEWVTNRSVKCSDLTKSVPQNV